MEITLLILHSIILVFLIRFIKSKIKSPKLNKYFFLLLSLKISFALSSVIVILKLYPNSDLVFFIKSHQFLFQYFKSSPLEYFNQLFFSSQYEAHQFIPNAWLNDRLVWYFRIYNPVFIFAIGDIWMSTIYLSIFSFSASIFLYEILVKYFKLNEYSLLIGLFLIPSVNFWATGLLKESFALTLLFSITARLLYLSKNKYQPHIIDAFLLIGFYLLVMIKFYYAAALFCTIVPYFTIEKIGSILNRKDNKFKIRLFTPLILSTLFIVTIFDMNLKWESLFQNILTNHQITLNKSSVSSATINFIHLEPNLFSFLKNVPLAAMIGIFGPFINDIKKTITIPAVLESIVFSIIFFWSLIRLFKRKAFNQITFLGVMTLVYIIGSASFLTIASPNWGTLIRYKVIFAPYLWILFSELFFSLRQPGSSKE